MPDTVSIVIIAVLAVLLVERFLENRRLSRDILQQQETNRELLKRVSAPAGDPEPLTVERIAEAIRKEGFLPDVEEAGVRFKAQGENYFVDTERLPLFFLVKGYNLNPDDWDVDLLREAARQMSDDLAMVKANIASDNRSLNFFVGAQDRNYESFRSNLVSYLHILEDGQRRMNEEYHRLETEAEDAAAAQSVIPPIRPENKVLS